MIQIKKLNDLISSIFHWRIPLTIIIPINWVGYTKYFFFCGQNNFVIERLVLACLWLIKFTHRRKKIEYLHMSLEIFWRSFCDQRNAIARRKTSTWIFMLWPHFFKEVEFIFNPSCRADTGIKTVLFFFFFQTASNISVLFSFQTPPPLFTFLFTFPSERSVAHLF